MSMAEALQVTKKIKEPKNLSPRITWLRDYYFEGAKRAWNNEFTAWTTGTDWDEVFDEMTFYIVPETYPFLQTFGSSIRQAARPVKLSSCRKSSRYSPPSVRMSRSQNVRVNCTSVPHHSAACTS